MPGTAARPPEHGDNAIACYLRLHVDAVLRKGSEVVRPSCLHLLPSHMDGSCRIHEAMVVAHQLGQPADIALVDGGDEILGQAQRLLIRGSHHPPHASGIGYFTDGRCRLGIRSAIDPATVTTS